MFFVLYHLCYENILHHTDGMEYLSDWTIVLGAAAGKDGVSRCERAYTPAHSLDAHRDEST